MAAAQHVPIATCIARCLDEVALEGRCGMAVRDALAAVDASGDAAYQRLVWQVLRSMRHQISFHRLVKQPPSTRSPIATAHPTTSTTKRKRPRSPSLSAAESAAPPTGDTTSESSTVGWNKRRAKPKSKQANMTDERAERAWMLQNSRGYWLGDRMDVRALAYEDAIMETNEGAVGMVACEELRLKCLGITGPTGVDVKSVMFDLLEEIGRSRALGVNMVQITESRRFGDTRKLHYMADTMIAAGLIVKNMITGCGARYNILHLTRFFDAFRPSMIAPTAKLSEEVYSRERLPKVIAAILRARGERACAFADIGREVGLRKQQQQNLREYILECSTGDPTFPLEVFMARCEKNAQSLGRSIWCVRLRSSTKNVQQDGKDHQVEPGSGLVFERCPLEHMHSLICKQGAVGATVPELRDMLGIPLFKLPYRLASVLTSSYALKVEQVVVGKNATYRMFSLNMPPDTTRSNACSTIDIIDTTEAHTTDQGMTQDKSITLGEIAEIALQSSHPRPRTNQFVKSPIVKTNERRKGMICDLLKTEGIVAIPDLRHRLSEIENAEWMTSKTIDERAIRVVLDQVEAAEMGVKLDISLPCKTGSKIVRCIATKEAAQNREAIRSFVGNYMSAKRRKLAVTTALHKDEAYRISASRSTRKPSDADSSPNERYTRIQRAVRSQRTEVNLLRTQGLKLGKIFGSMCRARMLHQLLWSYVPLLRAQEGRSQTQASDDGTSQSRGPSRVDLTFNLKDVVDRFSLCEFLQIVGVRESLTAVEEQQVRATTAQGASWEALDEAISHKVRGGEINRFSGTLQTLVQLGLLQVAKDSSHDFLQYLRTAGNFDQAISDAAIAALCGGRFTLKRDFCILLKRGDKMLDRIPSNQALVSSSSFSECGGCIPTEFHVRDIEDVKLYWKTLWVLCIEGAMLSGPPRPNDTSTNADARESRVFAAPLRHHNIHHKKTWHSTATMHYSSPAERAKAAQDALVPGTKRKRISSSSKAQRIERLEKKQRLARQNMFSDLYDAMDDQDESIPQRWRAEDALGGARSGIRAGKWTPEDDKKLIDLYIKHLSWMWWIDVPVQLQTNESVVFRSTRLSRYRIAWKDLAKTLNRTRLDITQRTRELLTVPAVRSRVEKVKQVTTENTNPGGVFHEQRAVSTTPELTALLGLSLQIILDESANYHPALADMLLNRCWTPSQVCLVWRYLWLAGVIVKKVHQNATMDKFHRAFGISSQLFTMKSLKIALYPGEFFREAAEYAAFVQNMADSHLGEINDGDTADVIGFEQEIAADPSRAQLAVALSAMLTHDASLSPVFSLEYEEIPARASQAPRGNIILHKRNKAAKGIYAHLSAMFDGRPIDDFAKNWSVWARYAVQENRTSNDPPNTKLQAFSTAGLPVWASAEVIDEANLVEMQEWVQQALRAAGRDGMTRAALINKCDLRSLQTSRDCLILDDAMDALLQERAIIEVNGFDSVRFVAREHSDMWTVTPYAIAADTTSGHRKFVLETDHRIVARPWLHMDGTVNAKAALRLKRRLLNIVMCAPGVSDHQICAKMKCVLSLQDTRTLLDEMIADDMVYARLVQRQPRGRSVFDVRQQTSQPIAISLYSPGDLRYVDNQQHLLRYFPSVNCITKFGSVICDEGIEFSN